MLPAAAYSGSIWIDKKNGASRDSVNGIRYSQAVRYSSPQIFTRLASALTEACLGLFLDRTGVPVSSCGYRTCGRIERSVSNRNAGNRVNRTDGYGTQSPKNRLTSI
jgi:hypothetical protein